MKNIFPALYKIDKKDFNAFIKQVKYKQNSPILIKSVDYIAQHIRSQTTDKKLFYQHIYNSSTHNENKLRQLIFRINKEFDKYLMQLNTKPIDNEFNLFIKQHQIGIIKNKHKTLKKITLNKKFNDAFTQSKINFLESYQLMHDAQFLDRTKDRYFQEANDSLDKYFIIEKLKLVSATLMHGKVFKIKYNLGTYDYFDELLKNIWDDLDKNIQLLYFAIKMIANNDEKAYNHIKQNYQILEENKCDENKQIITMCINFCIQKINSGDRNWLTDIFNWYKIQIANDYIIEKGQYLSEATFKNIISTSLLLKEINWAKNFCFTYYKSLNPSFSLDHYNYNLARIYYETKSYQKVLELLSKSDPQDTLINISIKVLLIKTWYALDEYDILDSNLESFKIYLYRHKNMGYHYTMNSNFIKILRLIIKGNYSSKATKNNFIQKIEQLAYITEKTWLLSLLK